jgi:hypothetical protein
LETLGWGFFFVGLGFKLLFFETALILIGLFIVLGAISKTTTK